MQNLGLIPKGSKIGSLLKRVFLYLFIPALFIGINSFISKGAFLKNNIGLFEEIAALLFLAIALTFIRNSVVRRAAIFTLFLIYFIIFTIQSISVEIIGSTINLITLKNATEAALLINSAMIIKLLFYLAVFMLFITLLLKIRLSKKEKYILLSILLALFFLSKYTIHKHFAHEYLFRPAKNLYTLIRYELLGSKELTKAELQPEDITLAHKFNIEINSSNGLEPFSKEYFYKDPLPFKRVGRAKPNVILFFIESLSARLLSPYRKSRKGLTPNIADFAKHSMVVEGYFNHTTPTAPGLLGQNCSFYPLYTHEDMDYKGNPLEKLHLKCMPQYFGEYGYKTYYMSHSRAYYANIKNNLKIYGYQNRYFWRDFLHRFLPGEDVILGEAGPSDHQMMRGLVAFLKQKGLKEPFLLGVSTIESHVGRKTNPIDGIKYGDGKSSTLNLIHNLDDAFGKFWNYFKRSKYAKNTIVILTGDHALFPNRDYQKVAGKDWIPSIYDHLTFIIYDPTHTLPKRYKVNANSVDMAPTLLHLAGVPNSKNNFLGRSIFDRREYNNSFGVTVYKDMNYYYNMDGKLINEKYRYMKKEDKKIFDSLKRLVRYYQYSLQR